MRRAAALALFCALAGCAGQQTHQAALAPAHQVQPEDIRELGSKAGRDAFLWGARNQSPEFLARARAYAAEADAKSPADAAWLRKRDSEWAAQQAASAARQTAAWEAARPAREAAQQAEAATRQRDYQAEAVCKYKGQVMAASYPDRSLLQFGSWEAGMQAQNACQTLYRQTGIIAQ